MKDKFIKFIIANTIASFSIVCVINAGLGCFSQTACNIAISNIFGISVGTAGFLIELLLFSIAFIIDKDSKIGWGSIINATYGSLLIDVFMYLLPKSPLLIIGIFLLPIAWANMERASIGTTGSNTLMNAILKKTKFNITVVRGVQEFILLLIGFLGASSYVTPFTIVLVFTLGPLLQIVYKWIHFDPTTIKHTYLIKQHN